MRCRAVVSPLCTWLSFLFLFMCTSVCLYVSMCMWEQVLMEDKGSWCPGAGVTGSLPNTGACGALLLSPLQTRVLAAKKPQLLNICSSPPCEASPTCPCSQKPCDLYRHLLVPFTSENRNRCAHETRTLKQPFLTVWRLIVPFLGQLEGMQAEGRECLS